MIVSAVAMVALFSVIRAGSARRAVARPEEAHQLALRLYLIQLVVPLGALLLLWTVIVHVHRASPLTLVAAVGYSLFFGGYALAALIGVVRLRSGDPLRAHRAVHRERLAAMSPEAQRAEAAEEERLRSGRDP